MKSIPLEAFGSRVAIEDLLTTKTELRLEHGTDGRLWASLNGPAQPVVVHRCFPWTAPTEFISLRDEAGEEVALVRSVDELAPAARAALTEELAVAGFILSILEVLQIEEEIEVRTWSVVTAQGPRRFQTARDEWPRELPYGGFVIKDVAGDMYHIADVQSMNARSKKLLWALVG